MRSHLRSRLIRCWLAALVAALALSPVLSGVAAAQQAPAQNELEGDNESNTTQAGTTASGDAVAGQVVGGVSAGDTSVDAKNRSEDVDAQSGDVLGTNRSSSFVGLQSREQTDESGDASALATASGTNFQEGDNDLSLTQTVNATSGDAVGGQVIGAVTAAGGSTDIVADNVSEDVDVETGEVDALNESFSFVGLFVESTASAVAIEERERDIGGDEINSTNSVDQDNISDNSGPVSATAAAIAANDLDGDNEANLGQEANASSGDGVAGEVIGAVSAGDTSIDARNRSEDVDIETGEASSVNASDSFTGLRADAESSATAIGIDQLNFASVSGENNAGTQTNIAVNSGTVTAVAAGNITNSQEGDNDLNVDQTSDAASGDGVGGQVIGAVTSAGGSADIVAANESEDVDITTGDALATSTSTAFSGLLGVSESSVTAIGIRQRNEAVVDGNGNEFVQTNVATNTAAIDAAATGSVFNTLDGDNEVNVAQAADAATGDGVGGQVIGAVSAGDTSIDARNRSEDVDVDTGDAAAANVSGAFAGQIGAAVSTTTAVGIDQSNELSILGDDNLRFQTNTASNTGAISTSSDLTANNFQEGDNTVDVDHTANASSGDGVGGEVIGVVTSAGGSADVVAANESEDVDVSTGDALSTNDSSAFAGLASAVQSSTTAVGIGQLNRASSTGGPTFIVQENVGTNTAAVATTATAVAANDQDGDNDSGVTLTADASTGDGVGGQVIGVVSAGDSSVDASNSSEDVDIDTGDSTADNDALAESGLFALAAGDAAAAGILQVNNTDTFASGGEFGSLNDALNEGTVTAVVAAEPSNVQEGDNEVGVDAAASASSGDGVGGQVAGVVTSAGGSADVVIANESEDADISTGAADAANVSTSTAGLDAETAVFGVAGGVVQFNTDTTFTGENFGVIEALVSATATNTQEEGDNAFALSQTADAASGDGVGGQVLGVVSAGDASIDASNRSEDVDVESGEADSDNASDAFVGLSASEAGFAVAAGVLQEEDDFGGTEQNFEPVTADIVASGSNLQDGDNDWATDQASDATSGDGVAGQVTGAVVTAGGTVDAVLANNSEDIDTATGGSSFANADGPFVGLNVEGSVFDFEEGFGLGPVP